MQRTEFTSSLLPQQGGQNLDDAPFSGGIVAESNGLKANAGYPSPARTNGPYIDVIRRTDLQKSALLGEESSREEEPASPALAGEQRLPTPGTSPASRLAGSPTWAPKYTAGVVRSLSKSKCLEPPPASGPPRLSASPPPSSSPAGLPAASPIAGHSPLVPALPGGASFSIYNANMGSPGGGTPSRQPSPPVANGTLKDSPCHSPCRSPTSLRTGVGISPVSNRSTAARGDNTPGGPAASPTRRRCAGLGTGRNSGSSRIDPEQVPRPVGQVEAVREEGGKKFETTKYHVPPSAGAVATILDRGSCSCEFIRMTVNQVPAYPSTANTAHVPVAAICQPFAELTPLEEPVPLVDFGEEGPLRCTRCKAYVNPHFQWQNHGREVICNLCGHRVDVPNAYYCNIDAAGKRTDHGERLELQRGTVDYVAPSDYSDTVPGVPGIVFVIEATQRSVRCGLLPQVLITLRGLLHFMTQPASRIAIITFDHALHFYAFYPGLDGARWITVSDIEEPFVPCGASALCIDALDEAYRSQVETLLRELVTFFEDPPQAEQAAGGAALKAAVELLGAAGGGHVIMCQASLQNTGVGALRFRDDLRLSTQEDSSGLYSPQQAPFFDAITAECLQRSIAVSVFLTPPVGVYVDLASLSIVPRRTGGEVCYIPAYDPAVDGERLHYELSRTVVQSAVYGCVFKLRCSKGLAVEAMYATWEPEVICQSTFHVSRLSVDATCDFVLSHSERIEGQKHIYLQVACLHTDRRGRRLIRVHTLQLPVTSSLSNVFRYTEIDAVTNLLIKQAASSAISGNTSFKDKLSKSCVDMLHAYRVNCASMTSAGQLILPESLKLLPLYVGSIRKMPAFRSGSDIRSDDRLAALLRVMGLPMALTAPLVYPRVYTVMPLPERAGNRTEVGDNVYLPPTIACSSDKLVLDRIYLVDTGSLLRLYIREEVSCEQLEAVFGVSSPHDVAEALERPEEELSEDAVRMLAIVWQIRRERTRLPWQPFSVVVSGTPDEARLLAAICEDRVAGEMNYVDFLCHIHKMVQNKQE